MAELKPQRPDPRAEGLRWLRQAEHDLGDAEYSHAGGRYNLACFLCQQAAEKALQGFLYVRRAEQVLGHSVADLVAEYATRDATFDRLSPGAAPLDSLSPGLTPGTHVVTMTIRDAPGRSCDKSRRSS